MHRVRGLVLFAGLAFATSSVAQMRVDTVQPTPYRDSGAFHMTRSPLLALGLSAVLPGAGQLYLGQAWKLPIIYGLMGGFLYGAYIQNDRYKYTRDSVDIQRARAAAYRAGTDSSLILLAPAQDRLADNYARVREFYRDDRDKWLIYVGLVYVANILDAYIAAHLYDFDVSDPGPIPTAQFAPNGDLRLGFSLRF